MCASPTWTTTTKQYSEPAPCSCKSLTLKTGAELQKWVIWKVLCWCFHRGWVQSRWIEGNPVGFLVCDNNQVNSGMKYRAYPVAEWLQHTSLKIIWIKKVMVVWCTGMKKVGLLSSGFSLWFCMNVRKQSVISYIFWYFLFYFQCEIRILVSLRKKNLLGQFLWPKRNFSCSEKHRLKLFL